MVAFNPASSIPANPTYPLGGQPAFDGGGGLPNSVSELLLWLDANDSPTLTEVSGAVSVWEDKPGLGVADNATQGTSGKRPVLTANEIGGLPAVVFDGTDDFMTGTTFGALTGYTIFVVTKHTAATTGVVFSVQETSPQGRLQVITNADGSLQLTNISTVGNNISRTSPAGTAVVNTPFLLRGTWDGGTSDTDLEIFKNGTQVDNASAGEGTYTGWTSSTKPYEVGSQEVGMFPLPGVIGELLMYSRKLTSDEISLVERQLTNKWSL